MSAKFSDALLPHYCSSEKANNRYHTMDYVDVVAFLVYENGRVLVEKRSEDKEVDPGIVVTPSGHVEKSESLDEACHRELKEELGLECEKLEKITEETWDADVEKQLIHYFEYKDWRGEPEAREAEEIYWVGPEDLEIMDIQWERKLIKEFFEQVGTIQEEEL